MTNPKFNLLVEIKRFIASCMLGNILISTLNFQVITNNQLVDDYEENITHLITTISN